MFASEASSNLTMPTQVPLLDGSLYYVAYDAPMPKAPDVLYLNADYRYIAYFEDFGPFHLGTTMQFCDDLSALVAQAKREHKVVHACTRHGLEEQANMMCLLGCYAVLCAGMTPADALRPFHDTQVAYFHDATDDECSFELSVLDVVEGFANALARKYVVRDRFSVADYVHYESVEHGNLNWITPRLLAFAGPSATTHPPSFFVPYFQRHNITLVVGLNEPLYDATAFTERGIEHVDLSFPDGTTPSEVLLRTFFDACNATPGVFLNGMRVIRSGIGGRSALQGGTRSHGHVHCCLPHAARRVLGETSHWLATTLSPG
ncbi:hypothetical protein, variant [Saprolegnia diclina VS20]|uniref:Dual specificity/tyrosine protein phosphatase N-terminal domain-containing protein n=1 Tax=Saprolegnia diclina (strain VS20) TaxID=1156394 RepID=T0RCW8_SAPDV|nr:hypothetical protein, variant [Saprolegnia diclina VS20]EQC30063.1 hypothetical protein, variant [Saprolegnia diclina VS20]|eukprot:XP_008616630.1 hypothetical protein, variant [Saprolegnia diclina VS20]